MASNTFVLVQMMMTLVTLCQLKLNNAGEMQPLIVDGNPAVENQFPWYLLLNVTITGKPGRYCGGTLIAPNFVLTAATCIDNAAAINVNAGIISFYRPTETQISSQYLLHPNYDYGAGLNDIAIIRLARNFTYRNNVQSIKLPGYSQVNNTFVYQQCYFAGFGMVNETEWYMSPDLQYSSNVVVPNDYCKQNMNRTNVELCALSSESSVCFGDQGGGLVSYIAGTLSQIGLLTSINNINGCKPGYPHVYTKITDHLDWIAYLTGLKFDY